MVIGGFLDGPLPQALELAEEKEQEPSDTDGDETAANDMLTSDCNSGFRVFQTAGLHNGVHLIGGHCAVPAPCKP